MSPDDAPLGLQRWRDLLFVHWSVPVATLRPLVPARLAIHTFAGQAFVGVVAFEMRDVRPLRWLPPLPTAGRFLETNVRTYVTLDGRPGVWFFSLEAQSSLAVIGARVGYRLPYFRADMSWQREPGDEGARVRYRSRRLWPGPKPATLEVDYTIGAELGVAQPGSLEEFLVERYTLFAQRRDGELLAADVRHRPYPLRRAAVASLSQSLVTAAGLEADGARPPDLFSAGVDVEVLAPRRP